MKKILLLLSVVLSMSFMFACEENNQTVASRIVHNGEQVYVEVDGKPYNYIGIQLRTDAFMNCEGKTASELEPYFKLVSEQHINTIQLPIDWRDIEPDKDIYDFSVVETFLDLAKKYNLKAEFLWFSTNMCGETHTYHIPDYIVDDAVTYPRYESDYTGTFHSYYGYYLHLEFGNDNLLNREVKVVKKLMNFVNEWNNKKGKPNTLIGVQIHNEPDCFPLWRVGNNQIAVKKNGVQITQTEAEAQVNKALDTVGKAFKSTNYKIFTRVNFALANTMNDYIKSVYELEGIDIVGDDPHENNVKTISDALQEYRLKGNYPHIAENRASFSNTNSLILNAMAKRGGYIMYEIATSPFFIANSKGGEANPDYGLYTSDLKKRAHTDKVGLFLDMINKSGYGTVTASKDDFITFNESTNAPRKELEKSIRVQGNDLVMSTKSGALGYLIVEKDYLILASDLAITIQNLPATARAEEGYFVDGKWIKNSDVTVADGKLKSGAYKIYKIVL